MEDSIRFVMFQRKIESHLNLVQDLLIEKKELDGNIKALEQSSNDLIKEMDLKEIEHREKYNKLQSEHEKVLAEKSKVVESEDNIKKSYQDLIVKHEGMICYYIYRCFKRSFLVCFLLR